MNEPSEKEVEAVVRALAKVVESTPTGDWPGYDNLARAAIAAYEKAKAEDTLDWLVTGMGRDDPRRKGTSE